MSNQVQNLNAKKYDLEERTAKFGENIIDFARALQKDEVNKSLINHKINPI